MFTDEARFGRMNRIRACWAPVGVRPEVAAQLIREYMYLYGAVSPNDGTCVYLIMPTSNTASFQAFLDALARRLARQDILLVLDGAPNHRSRDLVVPDNIALLYLPPYSPELNPRKGFQELCSKVHERGTRQTQGSHPLRRAQSQARPIHHFLPLHHQLTLM
jgi:hypothetical protein